MYYQSRSAYYNNMLYFGLIDAKLRASEIDLPVHTRRKAVTPEKIKESIRPLHLYYF